ncbi:MAG TPA: hypothetical protein VK640_06415 [Actinomycetes bacterium]|nr:hypothetical protein [Actinomycetes bacterium]
MASSTSSVKTYVASSSTDITASGSRATRRTSPLPATAGPPMPSASAGTIATTIGYSHGRSSNAGASNPLSRPPSAPPTDTSR